MSPVEYSKIAVEQAGGRVRLACVVRNRTREPWRAADGFLFGYHVFDADTGTLIVDGPRVAAQEIAPGGAAPLEFSLDLPPEPGRYAVFVSPVREHRCWYYESGWPFLLLEAQVQESGTRLVRRQVTTRAAVRRRARLRSCARACTYPVATVWRNRSLIRTMVRRDILGRYRGSFGGAFWTVLNPLLLMLTYFFVFGVVLQTKFGNDPSRASFALYFLAGMLPWLAFSEAAGRAPTVLMEHRNFVKKLVFAVETLPVNLVAAGLVNEQFALALFMLGLLLSGGALHWSVWWLLALLVPQVLFTAGVSWLLAGLGVFVRDLGQIIGYLLTLWFFLTPICYPEQSLPPAALAILSKNPLFVLVRGYRDVFLLGQAPALGPLWKLWVLSAVVFVAGHAWFYKLRKSFPDVL